MLKSSPAEKCTRIIKNQGFWEHRRASCNHKSKSIKKGQRFSILFWSLWFLYDAIKNQIVPSSFLSHVYRNMNNFEIVTASCRQNNRKQIKTYWLYTHVWTWLILRWAWFPQITIKVMLFNFFWLCWNLVRQKSTHITKNQRFWGHHIPSCDHKSKSVKKDNVFHYFFEPYDSYMVPSNAKLSLLHFCHTYTEIWTILKLWQHHVVKTIKNQSKHTGFITIFEHCLFWDELGFHK